MRNINVVIQGIVNATPTEDGACCVCGLSFLSIHLLVLVILKHHLYQLVFVEKTQLLRRKHWLFHRLLLLNLNAHFR